MDQTDREFRVWILLNQGARCLRSEVRLGQTLLFGRSTRCDITVNEQGVSREHCRVEFLGPDQGWLIQDLESANGTFVGPIRVQGSIRLPFGESFKIGSLEVCLERADPGVDPFAYCDGCDEEVPDRYLQYVRKGTLLRALCPVCRRQLPDREEEKEGTPASGFFKVRRGTQIVDRPLPEVHGYALRRRIPFDRTGDVYEAFKVKNRKPVFLRILHIAPEQLERFRREIEEVLDIKHDGMLPIVSYKRGEEFVYVAHSAIKSIDLETEVEAKGPLPLTEALRATYRVASVLKALAQRDVLHLNLRPSHFLATSKDRYLLSDFGLAKFLIAKASMTGSTLIYHSGAYYAPEVLKQQPPDLRADIYSLGACLVYFLTGTVPFRGLSVFDLAQRKASAIVDGLKHKLAAPDLLFRVLEGMLSLERNTRCSSYDELLGDLSGLIASLR